MRTVSADLRRMHADADKKIARALGVTKVGLAILAKCAKHPEGLWVGGLASGNPGTAKMPLANKGLLVLGNVTNGYRTTITDAGREIVRRARQMGW